MKKIPGNASFGEVKKSMGGGLNRIRTVVSYHGELYKPRAEALAEIVRSGGGCLRSTSNLAETETAAQAYCRSSSAEMPRSEEAVLQGIAAPPSNGDTARAKQGRRVSDVAACTGMNGRGHE